MPLPLSVPSIVTCPTHSPVRFTADPTATALAVSVNDWDTGLTVMEPTDGEFFFSLPPFGPEILVTYPGVAPAFYGDANNDGVVDLRDATRLAQYANDDTIEIGPGADANGDYMIDLRDATRIAQYANDDTIVLGPQN